MPEAISNMPNKWAILIGVEHYDNSEKYTPLHTPRYTTNGNKLRYQCLNGCVNDVCAVQEYLIKTARIHPDNITTLLAPHADRNYISPLPPSYAEPTYNNIVNALQAPKGAKQGDLVYIHYSGHGARATTIFSRNGIEPTERSDLDEVLVPSDINHGGRYLRDLELGFLLKQMANAGLVVTAVLDCCHSGGAVRGDEDLHLGLARGILGVYESNPVTDEPSTDTGSVQWNEWIESRSRGQHGFFALTACQENETARERTDEAGTHGLLTYWLLRILSSSPINISSRSLYARIISNVQDANRYQTPYYVGDSNRSFFSNEVRSPVSSLTVKSESAGLHKEFIDREVWLDGGSIHGVREGSQYAILRSGHDMTEKFDESEVVALVQVTIVGTGESRAKFLQPKSTRWDDVKGGCQAVLQSLPILKRSTVCFEIPDESTRKDIMQGWDKARGDKAWLSLVNNGARFTVTIDKNSNFHIADGNGEFDLVVKTVLNPIPSSDLPALIYRLGHLARLSMTKSLANPKVDPGTSRLIKVSIEPCLKPPSPPYRQSKVKHHLSGLFEVQHQHVFHIKIENLSERSLGIVIINCASELGVEKIWPLQEPFTRLEVKTKDVALTGFSITPELLQKLVHANLPIVELVKVFACTPERDLSPLELQPLISSGRGGEELSSTGLDGLLAELDTQRFGFCIPSSRMVEPEWETVDLSFLISPGEAL